MRIEPKHNPRRQPSQPCLGCGKVLDANTPTGTSKAAPTAGDITVCLYCATVMLFTAKLGLAKVSTEELASLPNEVRLTIDRAVKAIKAMRQAEVKP